MKSLVFSLLALPLLAQAEPSPRQNLPIMGWSSWNHFRIHIDEVLIREQADAMIASGMHKAGYQFVNIDDGFFGGRDEQGKLFCHELKFPSGMKSLADYVRSKGLKPGIYSEGGKNTCGSVYDKDPRGNGVGLHGHEEQDLQQMLVEWGYDFIKVDWCGGLRQKLSEQDQYTKISQIIRRIKPSATFNVCRWEYPGDWVKSIADSWRISGDIEPTFDSILKIVDVCEPLWIHSGPGHFNDMDMLQVGRGMSQDEDKAHFTLWCMMNSPLLAGNDLRNMTPETIGFSRSRKSSRSTRTRSRIKRAACATTGIPNSGQNRSGKSTAVMSLSLCSTAASNPPPFPSSRRKSGSTQALAMPCGISGKGKISQPPLPPPAKVSPFPATACWPYASRGNPPLLRCSENPARRRHSPSATRISCSAVSDCKSAVVKSTPHACPASIGRIASKCARQWG